MVEATMDRAERRDRAFSRALRMRARHAPEAGYQCKMGRCGGQWYTAEELFWWDGNGSAERGYYCEDCTGLRNVQGRLFGDPPTLEEVLEWRFRSDVEGKMLAESVPGSVWPVGLSLLIGVMVGFGVAEFAMWVG